MKFSGLHAEALLDGLPCGYLLLTRDGTIQYANRWFESCVGRESGEVVGRRFQEFLAPGGKIFYEMQFAPTLILRGALNEIAFELTSTGGKRVSVLVNAQVQEDESGKRESVALVVYEIAQRKLYEDELRRQRREFEQVAELVRRSTDAIIRLTAEGTIESWNYGAETIFGVMSSEAVGVDFFDLLFPGDGEREASLALLKQGKSITKELRAGGPNGKTIDVAMSLTPHMDAPGILVAFSAVIRDITARKRAERALMQNEKLASVGRLASSIAHEINNPLEAVTNLLYILQDRTTDPEAKTLLRSADEELARVSHIARHTLRFYRQSSNRTDVNLCSVFDSVVGLYRVRFEDSEITWRIECDESLELHCYEGELRQILVHLVSNAYDAMRTGGYLRIRAGKVRGRGAKNGSIRVLLADNGAGIEPAVKRHLFEPFNSTKGIGGAGLGLWIARDLVSNNAGDIRIRSSTRAEHHGTVAILTFYPRD